MASYFISGIWKDESGRISHLVRHVRTSKGWTTGEKVEVSWIISAVEAGDAVTTIRWGYNDGNWYVGARVKVQMNGTRKELTTVSGTALRDMLENLPPMNQVIGG